MVEKRKKTDDDESEKRIKRFPNPVLLDGRLTWDLSRNFLHKTKKKNLVWKTMMLREYPLIQKYVFLIYQITQSQMTE